MTNIPIQNAVDLMNGSTAPTQATGNNTTRIANTLLVQNELAAFIPSETVIVRKNANTVRGEFNSIAAAVDSIIDSAPSKPYTVKVSAGVYYEPTINCSAKTNISIVQKISDLVLGFIGQYFTSLFKACQG